MNNWKTVAVPLFFAAYLLLGLLLVDDYGMSWDEGLQRQHGQVSAQYIKDKLGLPGEAITWQQLRDYAFRYHGVLFTLPAWGLERLLGPEDFREIFLLRHRLVFLLFWVGCIVFYFVARKRLGDWRWALLAVTFLIVSPRIFAHSFFNPKDLVLLPLFIFALASLIGFLENRTPGWAALHALTCAMAISMRVAAVILPALTLGFVLLELFNARFERRLLRRFGGLLALYLPLTLGLTIALWPYLWDQPFYRFGEAFEVMSQYTWQGKVLFRGELPFGSELPWFYAPYWIFISTPLLYTFLFFVGVVFWGRSAVASLAATGRLYRTAAERLDWLCLALFLAPLAAVIVKQSVLYDGWRHLYFIYPPFLLLGVGGLQRWLRQLHHRQDGCGYRCARRAFAVLIGLTLAYNIHFLIKNHPHQQVYFNALTLGDKNGAFDLDYWGLSYRQGFEWLAANDARDTIRVACNGLPGELNHRFLPDSLQQRFVLTDSIPAADYYMSNYRHWEPGLQAYRERTGPYAGEEVFRVMVEESKIMGIYRVEGAGERGE